MPVYELIDEAKIFPGYGMVNPGDAPVVTEKFLDPTPNGFELTGYGESPWPSLHAAVLGDGVSLDSLTQYSQIVISNDTGAVIECVANEDTDNPFPIMNGMSFPFTLSNDVGSLDITGAGTGTLYVNAVRK